MQDAETGEQIYVDTQTRAFSQRFLAAAAAKREAAIGAKAAQTPAIVRPRARNGR